MKLVLQIRWYCPRLEKTETNSSIRFPKNNTGQSRYYAPIGGVQNLIRDISGTRTNKFRKKNLKFFFFNFGSQGRNKLAILTHSSFSASVHSLLPKDNLFKNIFRSMVSCTLVWVGYSVFRRGSGII